MLLEAQADLEDEDAEQTLYERTDDYESRPHQLRQDNSTTNIVIVG